MYKWFDSRAISRVFGNDLQRKVEPLGIGGRPRLGRIGIRQPLLFARSKISTEELFDDRGRLKSEVASVAPKGERGLVLCE